MRKYLHSNQSSASKEVKTEETKRFINEINTGGSVIAERISKGDFDEDIIRICKSTILDFKRYTNTSDWKRSDSLRILAQNLGLDPNESNIVKELYNLLIYNKRFIRDRIMQPPYVQNGQLSKVDLVEIKQATPHYVSPPARWNPGVSTTDIISGNQSYSQDNPRNGSDLNTDPNKRSQPHIGLMLVKEPSYTNVSHTSNKRSNKSLPESRFQRNSRDPIGNDHHILTTNLPSQHSQNTDRSVTKPILLVLENNKSFKKAPQKFSEVKYVNWGVHSVVRCCPRCGNLGYTSIHKKIGLCSATWAVALLLSGVFLPCFWIPLVTPFTKDTLHVCIFCQFILGRVPHDPCHKANSSNELPNGVTSHSRDSQKTI